MCQILKRSQSIFTYYESTHQTRQQVAWETIVSNARWSPKFTLRDLNGTHVKEFVRSVVGQPFDDGKGVVPPNKGGRSQG